MTDAPVSSSAPAELETPLASAATELRQIALGVTSRETRRRLSVVADDLDAMSYTADVAAQVRQLSDRIDHLANVQGAAGAMIGAAAGHLSALRGDVDAIKATGVRRWLRDARKAHKAT